MTEENTLLTYRDLVVKLVPRWLRKGTEGAGIAGKLLYAIAIQIDAVQDALVEGVKRRFPGFDGEFDSLPLLGQERRIARGPYETDQGYADRLLPWQEQHRSRGGPYAMLEQLHGFWVGAFPIALVYNTGKRFSMATDGTITRDYVSGWTDEGTDAYIFKPTRGYLPRVRWKLFYYWTPTIGDDGLWGSVGSSGDPHWGDGGLWGVDLLPEEIQNLLLVPTEWNNAHAEGSVSLIPPALWGDPSRWQEPGLVCIPIR